MPPKASSSQLLPQGSAKSKAKKAAARRKTVTKKAEGDDPPAAAGAPGGPEPDDSADTQSNLDKDSQIVLDERETVAEDIPAGMLGAVMVETCVTVPRAQNVKAEADYKSLLYARFAWVFFLSSFCMLVQLFMMTRLFAEEVLVRRTGIEDNIVQSGLKNIWAVHDEDVMPLWDVEEDKPIVVGPNPSAIKDWTSDQIAETTVKLVMMLGAKPGAPPMNPLAWSYVIGDDPRYNFCGVALMMPWMLFAVQFVYLLSVMGLVEPHISGLRFCLFAQSVDNQWDGVDISDHVDLGEEEYTAYPTTNIDALSTGTRVFLVLIIVIRLIVAWIFFCVGFTYTQLSPDLDSTLGNLLNILLISALEDMVVAILLPVPVTNLMAHVKLGNKQFHYSFEDAIDEDVDKVMDVIGGAPAGAPAGDEDQEEGVLIVGGRIVREDDDEPDDQQVPKETGPDPAPDAGPSASGGDDAPAPSGTQDVEDTTTASRKQELTEEAVVKKRERQFQMRRFCYRFLMFPFLLLLIWLLQVTATK